MLYIVMDNLPTERILIIGAGATGVVFGRHLQLGGADVTWFAKPKYAGALRSGLVAYPLNRPKRQRNEAVVIREPALVTSVEELAGTRWDQVWLCVSSPALRSELTQEILTAARGATVVMLQPGLTDRDLLLRFVDEADLVAGMISFIAWPGPLPGETLEPPGTAYWFPPAAPCPFSGDRQAVARIAAALNRGGLPAVHKHNVRLATARGSATLLCAIAALECADWSLKGLRQGAALDVGTRAMRQALHIATRHVGASPGMVRLLSVKPLLKLVLALAPHVVPFALEPYLKLHFTKVGDQTRDALARYQRIGAELNLPSDAIAELAELRAARLARIEAGSDSAPTTALPSH